MRYPEHDKMKSADVLMREMGMVCTIPGCGKPLTHMQGPNSKIHCREHQLNDRAYGGMGRSDRPHTHHRKFVCDHCGTDAQEAVDSKYPGMKSKDPDLFYRLCRSRMIGDHIIRQADGGDDSADNIQSLCLCCNSDKSILSEDYRPANKAA